MNNLPPLDSDTFYRMRDLIVDVLFLDEEWTAQHEKLYELLVPYLGE